MIEGENFYRRMEKDETVFYRIKILTLVDKRCMNDIMYQHLQAIIIWSFINIKSTEFILVQIIKIELLNLLPQGKAVSGVDI